MNLDERCQTVELILSDVDGVLTDGRLTYDSQGLEIKSFHVRDGVGVKLWRKAGCHFGLVTLRSSQAVKMRAAELGVTIVRQGTEDKLAALKDILAELRLDAAAACYVGDDLPDLPAVRAVGLGVAVADACPEVRDAADYVTQTPGGRGAVRETVELILKSQGRWEDLVQRFVT
jgi:YrbI family 3-deoxy-D-manno-octulosonate 8-phosphate phosphatase